MARTGVVGQPKEAHARATGWLSLRAKLRDISDTRESPAIKLISLLHNAGSDVHYHDPYVPSFTENGVAMSSSELDPSAYDCVVIVTNHSGIDYEQLVEDAVLVVDLRNATGKNGKHSDKVWKL